MSEPSTPTPVRSIVIGLIAGVIVGTATIYLSYTRLKVPQIPLDWVALILSGLTTGIISFFVVWGHFQKDSAQGRQ
jgi:hypothetical protein